jgi:hypothetical protein
MDVNGLRVLAADALEEVARWVRPAGHLPGVLTRLRDQVTDTERELEDLLDRFGEDFPQARRVGQLHPADWDKARWVWTGGRWARLHQTTEQIAPDDVCRNCGARMPCPTFARLCPSCAMGKVQR